MIARVVGYDGKLVFDSSKPDGAPRKLLDVGRLTALGWQARIGLEEGIAATYRWLDRELSRGATPRGFTATADNAA